MKIKSFKNLKVTRQDEFMEKRENVERSTPHENRLLHILI